MAKAATTDKVQTMVDYIEGQLGITVHPWQRRYLESWYSPAALDAERDRGDKAAALRAEIEEFGDLLVFARSAVDAQRWASRFGLGAQHYMYIGRADYLRGMPSGRPRIMLPGFDSRPDAADIRGALALVSLAGDREPSPIMARLQEELDGERERVAQRMGAPTAQAARPASEAAETAMIADPKPRVTMNVQDVGTSAQDLIKAVHDSRLTHRSRA